jgi:hypothetical protein
MQRRHLVALVAAAAFTVSVGCSSSDNSTATTTSTSTTTTAQSRSMAVDTPEGQVSLSLDGNLPPNWPTGFPVPDGATAAGSGSLGGSDSTVMVGVYTTSMSGEDAFAFYKTSSDLTVENPSSAGAGSAFAGRLTLAGTYAGSVTVVGGGSNTMIVVVLKSPGTGSNGTVVPPSSGTTPGTTPAA